MQTEGQDATPSLKSVMTDHFAEIEGQVKNLVQVIFSDICRIANVERNLILGLERSTNFDILRLLREGASKSVHSQRKLFDMESSKIQAQLVYQEKAKEHLAAQVDYLKGKIEELENSGSRQEEMESLRTQLCGTRDDLHRLQAEYALLVQDNSKLKQDNANIRADLDAANGLLARSASQTDDATRQERDIREKLSTSLAAQEALQQEVDGLNVKVEHMSSGRDSQEVAHKQRIATLENQVCELKDSLEASSSRESALIQDNESLTRKIANLKKELAALKLRHQREIERLIAQPAPPTPVDGNCIIPKLKLCNLELQSPTAIRSGSGFYPRVPTQGDDANTRRVQTAQASFASPKKTAHMTLRRNNNAWGSFTERQVNNNNSSSSSGNYHNNGSSNSNNHNSSSTSTNNNSSCINNNNNDSDGSSNHHHHHHHHHHGSSSSNHGTHGYNDYDYDNGGVNDGETDAASYYTRGGGGGGGGSGYVLQSTPTTTTTTACSTQGPRTPRTPHTRVVERDYRHPRHAHAHAHHRLNSSSSRDNSHSGDTTTTANNTNSSSGGGGGGGGGGGSGGGHHNKSTWATGFSSARGPAPPRTAQAGPRTLRKYPTASPASGNDSPGRGAFSLRAAMTISGPLQ